MGIRLFYSYSHRDTRYRNRLDTHLSQLRRDGAIEEWHDRKIGAGDEWRKSIDSHLRDSEVVLLLISADFLASDYCYDVEMTEALERHARGDALVIPIVVRATDWSKSPFAHLQALPSEAKPVTDWDHQDRAWTDVATGIRKAITGFAESQPDPSDRLGVLSEKHAAGRRRLRLQYDRTLSAPDGTELFAVAFSPDDSLVAAGSNGEVLLWSREAPDSPHRLSAGGKYIYALAFSPDGTALVTGGEDHVLRIFDVQARELQHELRGHSDAVYSVSFSSNGLRLASGGYDKYVYLWINDSGAWERQRTSKQWGGGITSVAFSPTDSNLMAFGSLDDTVTVWDFSTGAYHPLRAHTSSVETVAFSPDGRLVASAGLDKVVRVWDVASKSVKWASTDDRHDYLVRSVAFSPDGGTVASASWDKTVRLWDAESGFFYQSLPLSRPAPWHSDWIWSVAFSPNGLVLASGGSDGQVMLWSVIEARE